MALSNVDSLLPKIPGLRSSEVEPAYKRSKRKYNKQIIINVDPEIPDKSCTVDMTNVTAEQMTRAVNAAKLVTDGNYKEQATQTYRELAKIVAEKNKPTALEPIAVSTEYLPAYNPPRSSPLSVTPVQHSPVVPTQVPAAPIHNLPQIPVEFEMHGWGKLQMNYHSIVKNECLLVLAWDINCYAGMKFFPPVAAEPMLVRVGNTEFSVFSYGNTFRHNGYEYCLLVIDDEHQSEG